MKKRIVVLGISLAIALSACAPVGATSIEELCDLHGKVAGLKMDLRQKGYPIEKMNALDTSAMSKTLTKDTYSEPLWDTPQLKEYAVQNWMIQQKLNCLDEQYSK